MASFITMKKSFTNKKGRTIVVLPFLFHNHIRFTGQGIYSDYYNETFNSQ
jgi:hypothetical protein